MIGVRLILDEIMRADKSMNRVSNNGDSGTTEDDEQNND